MKIFPTSTHWEPLRPPGHSLLEPRSLLRPSSWCFWLHFGPKGCPRSSTAPPTCRKGDPKRTQWAPKRKPRGCQNAINTWGNAWSRMKNAINTWGSCMSDHLGARFGTPWKIKNENAISSWGNHLNGTKKCINTWGSCMSGTLNVPSIFEKHHFPYRKSPF